ncbi:hypothetical protein DFS33DRAFT_1275707 [Desarmillaria ectypa]|nr:hypothetical protein DFS33DRAFT_1275707 [Desarmillaria ectypa]
MAAWITQYKLDGIDVDRDIDFAASDAGDDKAEQLLADFTTQLRVTLPKDSYVLKNAPVTPWFSPTHYGRGGYLKVHKVVGNMIDWYNVQFYNRKTPFLSRLSLIPTFLPEDSGVDLSNLVVGRPATASDSSNGYMDPDTLATCLATAKDQEWDKSFDPIFTYHDSLSAAERKDGGTMAWQAFRRRQYPHGDKSWIIIIREKSWPV